MNNPSPLITVIMVLGTVFAAGCASTDSHGPGITGDTSARFTEVFQPGAFTDTPTVSVEHTFTLHNASEQAVTIVSHRTTINTVWQFVDTDDGKLPRTIAAGETVQISMRGRLYKPEPRTFYTELAFGAGETVRLEMQVED